jgi:hypothetical protein
MAAQNPRTYLTESTSRPAHQATSGDGDAPLCNRHSLENVGAELAQAAYPVMLRYGVVGNWLELELELWRNLTAIIKKRKQQRPSAIGASTNS